MKNKIEKLIVTLRKFNMLLTNLSFYVDLFTISYGYLSLKLGYKANERIKTFSIVSSKNSPSP